MPTAGKASIAGKKYQSDPAEWATGNQQTGWTCVKFSLMQDPQYYLYSYAASGILSAWPARRSRPARTATSTPTP